MIKRITTREFIKKAKQIHGNKYNYSKINYKTAMIKVIIICKIHGEFNQIPSSHLLKHGCPRCAKNKKLTTKEFIKKAKQIHGNKYDYSKTKYINSKIKITIICNQHGKFLQSPNNHLNRNSCPKCNKGIKLTTKEFIIKANKIHNNRYNYSKVNYINAITKVVIICPIHGKFLQTPHSHLSKSGCPKCAGNIKLTTKKFIKRAQKIHHNKYDYSKTKYKNSYTKVKIICKIHGEFLQSPEKHSLGTNCPKCYRNVSQNETKWLNKLEKEKNIKIERSLTININDRRFRPDGFHKATNTWYEYNGYFIHGHPNYYNPNDMNKMLKKTFGELYQKTLEKEKLIKYAGYNLITKWGK